MSPSARAPRQRPCRASLPNHPAGLPDHPRGRLRSPGCAQGIGSPWGHFLTPLHPSEAGPPSLATPGAAGPELTPRSRAFLSIRVLLPGHTALLHLALSPPGMHQAAPLHPGGREPVTGAPCHPIWAPRLQGRAGRARPKPHGPAHCPEPRLPKGTAPGRPGGASSLVPAPRRQGTPRKPGSWKRGRRRDGPAQLREGLAPRPLAASSATCPCPSEHAHARTPS